MDSHQNHPPEEARLHFLDYWRIIRIRKAIIITVFVITSVIATAVTFILASTAHGTRLRLEQTGFDRYGENGQRARESMDEGWGRHILRGSFQRVLDKLALKDQLLPPNINFRNPDQDLDLNIVANESRKAKIDIVLSNSFGFGGTNASVLIQKLAG